MKERKTMKTEPYSWESVSIDKYYAIKDIYDSSDEKLDKDIQVISVIEEIPESEIWDMSIPELQKRINKLKFLDKFELKKINPKKIVIEDETYCIQYDEKKMTVSQYVDWQTFVKMDFRQAIDKMLSVFVIPEGKTYNNGYDIVEVQSKFRRSMSFVEAQSCLNFIVVKYVESLKRSLKYLARIAKREKNKEIEGQIQHLKETLCSLGCAL